MPSEKVLVKLGFKLEGIRRQCAFWEDTYHDLTCVGLIRDEFTKNLSLPNDIP